MDAEAFAASLADAEELAALGRRTYTDHFAHIWTEAGLAAYLDEQFSLDRLRSEIAGDRFMYFVCRADARRLGYAKINLDKPLPVAPWTPGMELEKIYLRADAVGKGLGRLLLNRIFLHARERRTTCVWLDVLKSNADGRRMYERAGFSVVGELPFSTDIQKIDFWVMQRGAGRDDG